MIDFACGVISPLFSLNWFESMKKSSIVPGIVLGNADDTCPIRAGEPKTAGVEIGPKLTAYIGSVISNRRSILPWIPGPDRTTHPPPWQAATSPSPVLWETSAAWAHCAISLGLIPRSKRRSRAVRVARRAAAESPNPAPIGRVHSVITDAVTSSSFMTDVRSGESDAISKDVPSKLFCCILIEVLPEGLTVDVTPSLMTMPAPML